MKIEIKLRRDGELRLICARDTERRDKIQFVPEPTLVRSPLFQGLKRDILKRHKTGFGYISGRTRFCRDARRAISETAATLDSADRNQLLFFTGTVPGSTLPALQAVAAWSGWIVQTLTQWLRDVGKCTEYIGVWEWQKRGALHVHACVKCVTYADRQRLRKAWHARWVKIVRDVSARSGTDCFARAYGGTWVDQPGRVKTDVQVVEKSVASYLAKYVSKKAKAKQQQSHAPPSSWYFVSRRARQESIKTRRRCTIERLHPMAANQLFERLGGLVAGEVAKTFAYDNHYDAAFKAVVSLCNPLQASLLFDYIATLCRCLQRQTEDGKSDKTATVADTATYFCGQVLTTRDRDGPVLAA